MPKIIDKLPASKTQDLYEVLKPVQTDLYQVHPKLPDLYEHAASIPRLPRELGDARNPAPPDMPQLPSQTYLRSPMAQFDDPAARESRLETLRQGEGSQTIQGLHDQTRARDIGRVQSAAASFATAAGEGVGQIVQGIETPLKATGLIEDGIGNWITEQANTARDLTTRGDGGIVDMVAGGLGSTVPFLATSGAGSLAGLGKVGSAVISGGVGAVQGIGRSYEEAQDADATGLQTALKTAIGGLAGSTEAIPINRALGRLDKITGGAISRGVKKYAGRTAQAALSGAIEEAIQEVVQTAMDTGLGDQVVLGLERDLVNELAQGGSVGGIVGGILSGMFGKARVNALRRRQQSIQNAGSTTPPAASETQQTQPSAEAVQAPQMPANAPPQPVSAAVVDAVVQQAVANGISPMQVLADMPAEQVETLAQAIGAGSKYDLLRDMNRRYRDMVEASANAEQEARLEGPGESPPPIPTTPQVRDEVPPPPVTPSVEDYADARLTGPATEQAVEPTPVVREEVTPEQAQPEAVQPKQTTSPAPQSKPQIIARLRELGDTGASTNMTGEVLAERLAAAEGKTPATTPPTPAPVIDKPSTTATAAQKQAWEMTAEEARTWVTGGKPVGEMSDAEIADARNKANALFGEVNARLDSMKRSKELVGGLDYNDIAGLIDDLNPGPVEQSRREARGEQPWQRRANDYATDIAGVTGEAPKIEPPNLDPLVKSGDVKKTKQGYEAVTPLGRAEIQKANRFYTDSMMQVMGRVSDEQNRLATKGMAFKRHRAAVESALRDGKPVPPEVLADYPDLAPPAKPAQNADADDEFVPLQVRQLRERADSLDAKADALERRSSTRFDTAPGSAITGGSGRVRSGLQKKTDRAIEGSLNDLRKAKAIRAAASKLRARADNQDPTVLAKRQERSDTRKAAREAVKQRKSAERAAAPIINEDSNDAVRMTRDEWNKTDRDFKSVSVSDGVRVRMVLKNYKLSPVFITDSPVKTRPSSSPASPAPTPPPDDLDSLTRRDLLGRMRKAGLKPTAKTTKAEAIAAMRSRNVPPPTPKPKRQQQSARFHRGSIESAIAAVQRLKPDKIKYLNPTAMGIAIEDSPPPFKSVGYVEVHPDGRVVTKEGQVGPDYASENKPPALAQESSDNRRKIIEARLERGASVESIGRAIDEFPDLAEKYRKPTTPLAQAKDEGKKRKPKTAPRFSAAGEQADATATIDAESPLTENRPKPWWTVETLADFQPVDGPPDRKPDHVSASGSEYWETGDGVYRRSDHWGTVSTSRWTLGGESISSYVAGKKTERLTGYTKWTDFQRMQRLGTSNIRPATFNQNPWNENEKTIQPGDTIRARRTVKDRNGHVVVDQAVVFTVKKITPSQVITELGNRFYKHTLRQMRIADDYDRQNAARMSIGGEGSSPADPAIRKAIEDIAARSPSAAPTTVLDSVDQLKDAEPQAYAEAQRRGILDSIDGVFINGRVYIIANRIPTVERAERVWLEEHWHNGLWAIMRPTWWNRMGNMVSKSMMPEAELLAQQYHRKPFGQLSREQRNEVVEELIIRVAERRGANPTLWQRVQAFIRGSLRTMGFNIKLSEADILSLVRRADRARGVGRGGESRFSLVPGSEPTRERIERITGVTKPTVPESEAIKAKMKARGEVARQRAAAKARLAVELDRLRIRMRGEQATADGLREEAAGLVLEHLPKHLQGRYIRSIVRADSLAKVKNVIRRMRGALAKDSMREAVRNLQRFGRRIDKLSSNDLRKEAKGIYQRAMDAYTKTDTNGKTLAKLPNAIKDVYDAVDAVNEAVNELAFMAAEDRAAKKAFAADKIRTRDEHLDVAEANIKATGDTDKFVDESRKTQRSANIFRRIGRQFLDITSLASKVEGKFDGNGVLYNLMGKRLKQATDRMHLELKEVLSRLDTAAQKRGFKSLHDALIRMAGALGDASTERIKAKVGGKMYNLTLDQAANLVAYDPETQLLIDKGIGATFKTGKDLAPIPVTNAEIAVIAQQLRDYKAVDVTGFVEDMKREVDGMRPRVFAALKRLKGIEPEAVDQYFPRFRNRGQSETAGTALGWRDIAKKYSENAGFTKERERGTDTPLLVKGALATTVTHLNEALKIIHLAEAVRDADMVLSHPRMKRAIAGRWGEDMPRMLADMLAAQSLANETATTPMEHAINVVNRGLAGSYLTLNEGTFIRQLGGIPKLYPIMGGRLLADGLKRIGDKSITDRILKYSGFGWARYAMDAAARYSAVKGSGASEFIEVDPGNVSSIRRFITEAKTGARAMIRGVRAGDMKSVWRGWDEIRQSIKLLNYFDSLVFRVAWGGYEAEVNRLHPDWSTDQKMGWVAEKASDAIRATQNSSDVGDMTHAAIEGRGKVLGAFLLFTSDPQKSMNMLYQAAHQSKADFARAAVGVGLNSLWSGVVVTGGLTAFYGAMALLLKGDDDEESWAELREKSLDRGIMRTLQDVAGLGFGVGDKIVGAVEAKRNRWRGRDVFSVPAVEVINELAQSTVEIGDAIARMDETKRDVFIARLSRGLFRSLMASSTMVGNPAHMPIIRATTVKRQVDSEYKKTDAITRAAKLVGEGEWDRAVGVVKRWNEQPGENINISQVISRTGDSGISRKGMDATIAKLEKAEAAGRLTVEQRSQLSALKRVRNHIQKKEKR